MTKTLGFLLTACLASAACAGQAEVRYSGTVTTPELIAIDSDPSVMVVANADEPVFYSESRYWLYRDHAWYRSHTHRGGWVRVERPPERVRRIDRPTAYVHFRRNPAPRTTYNERQRPAEPARPYARGQLAPPVPVDSQVQPMRDQSLPANEPNPQGPQQPYANPRPPQQVPPAVPGLQNGPDRQIAPDPDRAPVTPGMRNRASDQRPAADRDDRRNLGPDRDPPLPPKE